MLHGSHCASSYHSPYDLAGSNIEYKEKKRKKEDSDKKKQDDTRAAAKKEEHGRRTLRCVSSSSMITRGERRSVLLHTVLLR